MADLAGSAHAEVNVVDRRAACLMKAAACREQALADPLNHDYWVDETIKWLEFAHAPASQLVVTIDLRPNEAITISAA